MILRLRRYCDHFIVVMRRLRTAFCRGRRAVRRWTAYGSVTCTVVWSREPGAVMFRAVVDAARQSQCHGTGQKGDQDLFHNTFPFEFKHIQFKLLIQATLIFYTINSKNTIEKCNNFAQRTSHHLVYLYKNAREPTVCCKTHGRRICLLTNWCRVFLFFKRVQVFPCTIRW